MPQSKCRRGARGWIFESVVRRIIRPVAHSIAFVVLLLCATAATAQRPVVLDLSSGWLRRDWSQCGNAAGLDMGKGGLKIHSDSSAVLFWQIPTADGRALELGQGHQWVRQCEAPSLFFWRRLREDDLDENRLLFLAERPRLDWVWQIRSLPQEAACAVYLRVVVTKKGSNELRELSFGSRCASGADSLELKEKTIVPGLVSYKTAYFTLPRATGRQRVVRDLEADYRRAFPKETPGRIVRLLIKAAGNPARKRVEVAVDTIRFSPRQP